MNAKTPLPASIERDDAASTDHIEEELRRYDAYLRDLRGLSPGSRRHDLRIAGRLLRQKFGSGVVDVARLSPADVRQFLADQLDARRTPSNAATLALGLRSYLRYRSACGDSVNAVTAVISIAGALAAGDLATRTDGGRG
jgi:integrase/recombinase XerD